MTIKTETLYRINFLTDECEDDFNEILYQLGYDKLEPVTVHVFQEGDKVFIQKVDEEGSYKDEQGRTVFYESFDYEKVTHVLSTTNDALPQQSGDNKPDVAGKGTSDDYEWVLLKEGDEIREGDEVFYDSEWSKPHLQRASKYPVRRKVSKSELQKKVEELEKTLSTWQLCFGRFLSLKKEEIKAPSGNPYLMASEIIDHVQETIASQNREIDRLKSLGNQPHHVDALCHVAEGYKKENDRLKSELAEMQTDRDVFALSNGRLERELEEAKKGGVKWEKCKNKSQSFADFDREEDTIFIVCRGHRTFILKPEKEDHHHRTIDDEAQEAWMNSLIIKSFLGDRLRQYDDVKTAWIEDYKARAAKEAQNG